LLNSGSLKLFDRRHNNSLEVERQELELDVYTLMYALLATLGIAMAYVIAGQRIKHLMHLGRKTSNLRGQAASA